MAFQKNWKQFIVSKGEPFQIEYLDRKFGGRPETVFEVTEDGVVLVNGQVMDGSQNITGSLTASTTITGADLVATDDLTVGDDAAIGGDLAVTGTTTLTGAVSLPNNTVTGDDLADALAAQIPMTATLTVGGVAATRTVTIQVKDAGGTNMALVGRYDVWVSASAKGTPIGTSTTGLTTSFTTGTLALTKLANLDFEVLSDASGVIVAQLADAAGGETRYVNIAINGVVYASAAVITA
jgi:hypothetical protein